MPAMPRLRTAAPPRARALAVLVFAAAACEQGDGETFGAVRQSLAGDTVYHLKNVNVSELRSIDVEVAQRVEDGNLVLALCVRHNSVWNSALGLDHFYYEADASTYPVLSANEPGWQFNFDGQTADGFGSFLSRKSANAGGRGGTSCANPLVFTLNGDPTAGTDAPLEIAVHLRFDGDCSGWVSNRPLSGAPASSPGCRRKPDCVPCR